KPESEIGKAGSLLGAIVGLFSLLVALLGQRTLYSDPPVPLPFYGIEFIWIIYGVPTWMLVMSIYFLEFGKTSNKHIGFLTGIIGLGASLLGFFVAVQWFPINQWLEIDGWIPWVTSWEIGTFVMGIALLVFGIAYIKVHIPTRGSNPYGVIAGVLYLFVGIFGMLIGLGTGLTAFPLFDNYTWIPWMYFGISFPSLFGIIS
ncbi:MAG: hypothetical protein ACXADL_09725, partial [Candidatus Thorarchaeota archaeon]